MPDESVCYFQRGEMSSLPNFNAVEVDLHEEQGPPTRRAATPHRVPVERPTHQSLEAVRLAEEESRIARAERDDDHDDTHAHWAAFDDATAHSSGVSSVPNEAIAAFRDLYGDSSVAAQVDEPGSVEPEPFDLDPFGGLIPVENEDPFGALVGVQSEPPVADERPTMHAVLAPGLPLVSRAVPVLLVDRSEMSRLPMDPRTAFLLCHIDGVQSLEEILDVCAMPEAEAFELIERLRRMGVIAL